MRNACAERSGCDTAAVGGTVVVVGSCNVDLVVGLERMPDAGETVLGRTFDRFPGGKGLNQAVAAARMGARVVMVGAVGSDEAGDWLRDLVRAEGIDDAALRSVDGPSGTAVIEVDDHGRNRIVVIPGANAAVTADQVEHALASIDDVAVVLVQQEVPEEAVEAAMRAGRARGARTILNPAPARAVASHILGNVDLLVPNEHEAALLSDVPTLTAEQAHAAANRLLRQGPACVVITRGEHGALWCDSTGSGMVDAFAVDVIDTVAAGDAFCGSLAAALAEGRSLPDALTWGCAAGAMAASASGAVPSLPVRHQVEALSSQRHVVVDAD